LSIKQLAGIVGTQCFISVIEESIHFETSIAGRPSSMNFLALMMSPAAAAGRGQLAAELPLLYTAGHWPSLHRSC
jgi:hypothetical protein